MAGNHTGRNQIRKEKVQAERVQLFVADYVKHKFKNIYTEAVQYHGMLREKNPRKIDLKRTEEYRKWVEEQKEITKFNQRMKQLNDKLVNTKQVGHGEYPDNLQLKISLLDGDSIQKKPKNPTAKTLTEGEAIVETMDEGTIDIEPSFEEIIAPELLDEIINDLRQDPDLQNIITDLEDQLAFEELDIGMNIELSDDERLEKELL